MDAILQYIIDVSNNRDRGTLPEYSNPSEPEDLGGALTQDEINTLKRFVKEIKERFPIVALGDDNGNAITDDEGNIITIEI